MSGSKDIFRELQKVWTTRCKRTGALCAIFHWGGGKVPPAQRVIRVKVFTMRLKVFKHSIFFTFKFLLFNLGVAIFPFTMYYILCAFFLYLMIQLRPYLGKSKTAYLKNVFSVSFWSVKIIDQNIWEAIKKGAKLRTLAEPHLYCIANNSRLIESKHFFR